MPFAEKTVVIRCTDNYELDATAHAFADYYLASTDRSKENTSAFAEVFRIAISNIVTRMR